MNRPLPWIIIGCCVLSGATQAWAQAAPSSLVISQARDTSRGFVARDQSDLAQRVLAWPDGLVATPDTLAWLAAGDQDLAFVLRPDRLVALGSAGVLDLAPGRFDIDTPLLLSDGTVSAFLADGRLEVTADRVIYRAPGAPVARGGTLLILAGVAIATAALLRAVRRRPRRS